MQACYTDGTPVQEGDRIRYHQTPGGLLPHGDWTYGTAAKVPTHYRQAPYVGAYLDPDELYLFDGQRYFHMAPHIIERDVR